MGQYPNLNPEQQGFLVRLAEFCQSTGCYDLMCWSGVLRCRERPEATCLRDVPTNASFYLSLAELGFITVKHREVPAASSMRPTTEVTVNQLTLDFAEYLQQGRFAQFWCDFRYDLAHDDTIRSKTAWLVAGLILSGVLAKLLSLLGWI